MSTWRWERGDCVSADFTSLRFPSIPFASLPFHFSIPSLPFRSLPLPFIPFHSLPFPPFPPFHSIPSPSLPFPSLPFDWVRSVQFSSVKFSSVHFTSVYFSSLQYLDRWIPFGIRRQKKLNSARACMWHPAVLPQSCLPRRLFIILETLEASLDCPFCQEHFLTRLNNILIFVVSRVHLAGRLAW